jgi:hypothetical protein
MHQQLWGYKVEEKLYVGLREQKKRVVNIEASATLTGKRTVSTGLCV